MRIVMLLPLCFAAGCATHPRAAKTPPLAPIGQEAAGVNLHPEVVTVETRYELAGHYDPADPTVWHTAHVIYRKTEVARSQAKATPPSGVEPLATITPASYDPLPPSAELLAELAEQRQITAELAAIKARMLALQDQAQTQYQKLAADRTETGQLRQELETELARIKDRQAKARNGGQATASADPTPTNPPDVKW